MVLGEYMYATEVDNLGLKTKRWTISASRTGATLGTVAWLGKWRQYVFHPHGDFGSTVIFNAGCLEEIARFLREQMEARR